MRGLFSFEITYQTPYLASDFTRYTLYDRLTYAVFRYVSDLSLIIQKVLPFFIGKLKRFFEENFGFFNFLSVKEAHQSLFLILDRCQLFLFLLPSSTFQFLTINQRWHGSINHSISQLCIFGSWSIPVLIKTVDIVILFLDDPEKIVLVDLPLLLFHLMHVIFYYSALLKLFYRNFTH